MMPDLRFSGRQCRIGKTQKERHCARQALSNSAVKRIANCVKPLILCTAFDSLQTHQASVKSAGIQLAGEIMFFSFRILRAKVTEFRRATRANVSVMFALSIVPMAGAVGAAVDYSQANSVKSAMQAAADTASLTTIKSASTLNASGVQTMAAGVFSASLNRPGTSPVVTATYDSASTTVSVTATAAYKMKIASMLGVTQTSISVTSKATLGGSQTWPVCVMITNPTSGHTLLVQSAASIDFTNCMVQVNTANWDAVEARDTSYIHSTNGVNCFVGDIHYGDVTPPKQPTCTMFSDPYASYAVPTGNPCTYTNKSVNTSVTLMPGTYCGGIKITGSATVTFSPGVYYIQNGDFQIQNSANVVGNGVTFLISGQNSNLNFTTSGTITMSAYTGSDAGQWAGFLFYWDQPSTSKGSTEVFSTGTMTFSGVLYFVGQTLSITNGANVTVNPGSILADMLLPNKGKLSLTGVINSPTAAQQAMKKSIASNTPVLVR
jgi:Flp pilus assembly protein TadG